MESLILGKSKFSLPSHLLDLKKPLQYFSLLLATRLINHCERFAGRSVTSTRKIINDAYFVAPFEKDGDLIQMEMQAETFITSKKPLGSQKVNFKSEEVELPNLFPLKHTVSIPQCNIYEKKNVYRKHLKYIPLKLINMTFLVAINKITENSHPHTILVHFSHLDVHNLFGTEVTESQFESRALLKAFTVAAAQAQGLYGVSILVVHSKLMNYLKILFSQPFKTWPSQL